MSSFGGVSLPVMAWCRVGAFSPKHKPAVQGPAQPQLVIRCEVHAPELAGKELPAQRATSSS